MQRLTFCLGIWLAGLIIGCGSSAKVVENPTAIAVAPLVPSSGAILGHFYGAGTISQTVSRLGRQPAIHLTYFDWEHPWTTDSTTTQDLAKSRIPLINWEPSTIKFQDIVAGKHDGPIAQ